jgi:hypothetical protein
MIFVPSGKGRSLPEACEIGVQGDSVAGLMTVSTSEGGPLSWAATASRKGVEALLTNSLWKRARASTIGRGRPWLGK